MMIRLFMAAQARTINYDFPLMKPSEICQNIAQLTMPISLRYDEHALEKALSNGIH